MPGSFGKPSKGKGAQDVHEKDREEARGSDVNEHHTDPNAGQRACGATQEHGEYHSELRIHGLGKVPVSVQHMGYSLDCSIQEDQ